MRERERGRERFGVRKRGNILSRFSDCINPFIISKMVNDIQEILPFMMQHTGASVNASLLFYKEEQTQIWSTFQVTLCLCVSITLREENEREKS